MVSCRRETSFTSVEAEQLEELTLLSGAAAFDGRFLGSFSGLVMYDTHKGTGGLDNSIVHETAITGTTYTPTTDLPYGDFQYWVRGVSDAGTRGFWSAGAKIHIVPTVISPAPQTLNNQPTFEWSGVSSVTPYYDLWLDRSWKPVATPTQILGATWTPAAPLPNGSYMW